MSTIYRKAACILAWLGDADDETIDALDRFFYLSESGPQVEAERNLEAGREDLARALLPVCLRPWARRVWVQQEVFAARRLLLACGRWKMDLEDYKWLVEAVCQSPLGRVTLSVRKQFDALAGLVVSPQNAISLDNARLYTSWTFKQQGALSPDEIERISPIVLERILQRGRNLEATDPRDFVYALAGLSSHKVASLGSSTDSGCSEALAIAYTRDVSQVFQDATRSIMNRSRNLGVLVWAGSDRPRRLDAELPSWAVDWSIRPKFPESLTDLDYSLPYQDDRGHGTLELLGFRFGSVQSISSAVRQTPFGDKAMRAVVILSHIIPPPDFSGSRHFYHKKGVPKSDIRLDWTKETRLIDGGVIGTSRYGTNVAPGDLLVLVYGWNLPLILRQHAQSSSFSYVYLLEAGDNFHLTYLPALLRCLERLGNRITTIIKRPHEMEPRSKETFVIV